MAHSQRPSSDPRRGKVAGTLVTADELPYWLEKGVQFFYVHSGPSLRLGLNGIKKSFGRWESWSAVRLCVPKILSGPIE